MDSCTHKNLILLAPPKNRIRCTHCHLTLKREELRSAYCPECYEAEGVKRKEFEEVAEPENQLVNYSCEDCGAFIPVEE